MNRKMYRICLIMVIALAVVSGILYYQLYENKEVHPENSVFVWVETNGSEYV